MRAVGRLFPDRSLGLAPGSVRDYRELARRRLPRQLFDYIDGGAYEESTLAANVADLAAIELRQRVLRDVSDLSLARTVLGQELSMPVVLGPVGLAGMYARRGRGAGGPGGRGGRGGVLRVDRVDLQPRGGRRRPRRPIWFQLYVMRDRRTPRT